jgi:hypothetical protein
LERAGVRIWDGATVGCAAARWHGQVGSSRMQALDSCRRPPQQHAGLHWASRDAAWFSVVSRCCKAIPESLDRDVLGSVSQPHLSAEKGETALASCMSAGAVLGLLGFGICRHLLREDTDPQCRVSLTMKMGIDGSCGSREGCIAGVSGRSRRVVAFASSFG